MEFVIGWSIFGVVVCVLFYVATVLHRKYLKQKEQEYDPRQRAERCRRILLRRKDFREFLKKNLADLPSTQLPKLAVDWAAVDRFIKKTCFSFKDNGDTFRYGGGVNYWDVHYIPKSEFDGDTLSLIEQLDNDLKWFIDHPICTTISEEHDKLAGFLREKYPGLSENSVDMVGLRFWNFRIRTASIRFEVKEREEYQKKTEYNRTHLPSTEPLGLSPDWQKVNEFILVSRFRFDIGDDEVVYTDYDSGMTGKITLPKSDFDEDSLKLLAELKKDVDWFYEHHTGNSAGECGSVLEGFLREKYPKLTEKSVSRIVYTYCINDR